MALTEEKLNNAEVDLATIEQVANLPAYQQVVSRLGLIMPTLAGRLASLGMKPPVNYANNLAIADGTVTVSYGGNIYSARPELTPFNTGVGGFDANKWLLLVKPSEDKFARQEPTAQIGDGGGVALLLDSLTAGAGPDSYQTFMRKMIRAQAQGKLSSGYSSLENGGQDIASFFKTASWNYNSIGNVTYGAKSLDGKGLYATGGTGLAADYFTWTVSGGARYFRIYYRKAADATSFRVSIGGESVQYWDVNANNGTEDVGYLDIDIGAEAPTVTTLVVSRPNGNIFIQGIRALQNITDPYVANLAVGGRTLASVAAQDSTFRQKWWTLLGFKAAVIDAGMNDRITDNAATHYANLTAVVADIRTALPTIAILILQSNEPSDAATTNFLNYTAQKQLVASEKGAAFIDLRDYVGNYATAVSRGLMLDAIHGNSKLNHIKAIVVYDWVLPFVVGDPGFADTNGISVFEQLLPPKSVIGQAAGAAFAAYDIGLINGFTIVTVELDIRYGRNGTSAGKRKLLTVMLSGNTVVGQATPATGVGFVANEIFSTNAGDAQSGDFSIALGTANTRVQINITPTTYVGNFRITGKITKITGTQNGRLAYLF